MVGARVTNEIARQVTGAAAALVVSVDFAALRGGPPASGLAEAARCLPMAVPPSPPVARIGLAATGDGAGTVLSCAWEDDAMAAAGDEEAVRSLPAVRFRF